MHGGALGQDKNPTIQNFLSFQAAIRSLKPIGSGFGFFFFNLPRTHLKIALQFPLQACMLFFTNS
jgi:hypothetical protein